MSNAKPPLRLGIMLEGANVSRFTASVLQSVCDTSFSRLQAVIYNGLNAQADDVPHEHAPVLQRAFRILKDSKRRRVLAYHFYQKWDARLFYPPPEHDTALSVDISELLQGVEQITVTPSVKGFTHRFPANDVARIREYKLDVILRFGFNILRGEILNAARYGVWSYHHDDNEYYRGAPPCFWELYEGNPFSGSILQRLTETLDGGQVLCKGVYSSTRGISQVRNKLQPYWGSSSFAAQKICELHGGGWERLEKSAPPVVEYKGRRTLYRSPNNGEMIGWLASSIVRKGIRRLVDRPTRQHWRIAFRRSPGPRLLSEPDLSTFRWASPPQGYFWADPFLLEHEGRVWAFFEDFNYQDNKAAIRVAAVDSDGQLVDSSVCLKRPYHLSYPFVFKHEGEIFMIPESASINQVELWRCKTFPNDWLLEKVLCPLGLYDTTPLFRPEGVYFFGLGMEPHAEAGSLELHYASDLTSEWKRHPLSPISHDVRVARPGGPFLSLDGKLIRPSQNCGPTYGYSLMFNEVLELSPEEYREKTIAEVEPKLVEGMAAIHTYGSCAGVEVIDGAWVRRVAELMAG